MCRSSMQVEQGRVLEERQNIGKLNLLNTILTLINLGFPINSLIEFKTKNHETSQLFTKIE